MFSISDERAERGNTLCGSFVNRNMFIYNCVDLYIWTEGRQWYIYETEKWRKRKKVFKRPVTKLVGDVNSFIIDFIMTNSFVWEVAAALLKLSVAPIARLISRRQYAGSRQQRQDLFTAHKHIPWSTFAKLTPVNSSWRFTWMQNQIKLRNAFF